MCPYSASKVIFVPLIHSKYYYAAWNEKKGILYALIHIRYYSAIRFKKDTDELQYDMYDTVKQFR